MIDLAPGGLFAIKFLGVGAYSKLRAYSRHGLIIFLSMGDYLVVIVIISKTDCLDKNSAIA